MLVLTRTAARADIATIMITDPRTGDEIEVIIIETRGDQVRIGINAPPHVVVDRTEIALLRAAPVRAAPVRAAPVRAAPVRAAPVRAAPAPGSSLVHFPSDRSPAPAP